MSLRKSLTSICILFCLFFANNKVFARESCDALFLGFSKIEDSTTCGVLGLAAIGFDSPYTNDTEIELVPIVTVVWESLYIDGAEVGVLLYNDLSIKEYSLVTAFVRMATNGYDASDEPQLSGLESTDEVAELGLRFSYGGNWGEVQAAVGFYVTSNHDSFVGEVSYVYGMRISGYDIGLTASAEYLSEDAADYYYGVDELQQRTMIGPYQAEASLNFSFGYFIEKQVSENWSVFHFGSFTALDAEIKDSPLTVDGNAYAFSLGALYKF